MHVAIIGGGITGLTAGYSLTKSGQSVTLFEKEPYLGGLAFGFRAPHWQWHIEGAYHHLFTNDTAIIDLLRDIGLADSLIVKRPVTASLWGTTMYPLDSPISLLSFPGLSLIDKLRTAALIGILKITPFWKPLEQHTAESLIRTIGGNSAWNGIWEPLLYGKFGDLAPSVSAAWFWARIKKRTPELCYIRGGFHTLVKTLENKITATGGTVLTETTITSITKNKNNTYTISWGKKKGIFDRILITTPTPIALKLLPSLLSAYTKPMLTIAHLHAQVLIVETQTPILDKVYWLNVTNRTFPFLAAVAHTNFMDSRYYGNHHLTYFGNYLPSGHPYLSMNKDQLLKVFLPFIKRLTPDSRISILNTYMFNGPYAQPVHERGYSQKIPPIQTPLTNVYMANMDYVFPWDRGTNYAVELGLRAARAMSSGA